MAAGLPPKSGLHNTTDVALRLKYHLTGCWIAISGSLVCGNPHTDLEDEHYPLIPMTPKQTSVLWPSLLGLERL